MEYRVNLQRDRQLKSVSRGGDDRLDREWTDEFSLQLAVWAILLSWWVEMGCREEHLITNLKSFVTAVLVSLLGLAVLGGLQRSLGLIKEFLPVLKKFLGGWNLR